MVSPKFNIATRPTRRSVGRATGRVIAAVLLLSSVSACGLGGADADPDSAAGSDSSVATNLAVTVPASGPPSTAPGPVCVVTVKAGDSLSAIASRTGVSMAAIGKENALDVAATIHPGQVFDICVGNDIDDVIGVTRLAPPTAAVIVQQNTLNELFSQYELLPLVVDGDSGGYTRQAICAARMGLGLPVHNGHLVAGSKEEATIFAATKLSIPAGAPTGARKWILIDKTCQVIFTGERDKRVVNVFPTSTGVSDFETRNVSALAFRFDPASDNGGWHDSATFPVAGDNARNGNMYKPLYFADGQAMHGASFIPPTPRSKGCARTYPKHQDMMLAWLGLDDRTQATWSPGEIGVTIVVRGRFQDRSD